MSAAARLRIPVGVVVERHKATSPWLDFVWRPVSVLPGIPVAKPWTPLGPVGDTTTFFAGTATIALYRTETANYIDNLGSGAPLLWVVLRPTEVQPPYEVLAVTADPAEGEAFTEAGNDLVETVAMPADIEDAVAAFVAEHHVDRAFFKRQRDSDNASGPGSRRKERGR
ncbi:MAG TPA: DUF3305 domain-containing protein [Hyphomicrobiaceae bacterium]|nr:DUF3305 domain-containing protein [Hyphomicrobiaceae bacterium]